MDVAHLCMGCMNDKGEQQVCPCCGWMEGTIPDVPQHLPPRSILNQRYLIGRVLGQGGFGITYLAWDQTLNTRLAIKEYLPQAMATRYAGDTTVVPYSSAASKDGFNYGLERFLDEARTLARFSENPHIVSVRDYFSANGTAYLVMAYIDGITFKQYIAERGGRISYENALTIMAPVMEALEEVHAVGLLHRDISPDNIFITRNNLVKILDFGAARYAIGEQSRSLSVILKAGYAPEEQYRSKGVQGPWTDIYATASTFYRAITGAVPPEALDRMHDDQLEPPSRLGVAIPAEAEAALLKALAVLGANRFQTMREFRDSIMAASPGSQKVFTPPVQPVAPVGVAPTVPLGKEPAVPAPPVINATVPLAKAGTPPPVSGGIQGTAAGPVLEQTMPAGMQPAGMQPAGMQPAYTQAPPDSGSAYGQSAVGGSAEATVYSSGGYVPPPDGPGTQGTSGIPAAPQGGKGKSTMFKVAGVLLVIVLLAGGGLAYAKWGSSSQGTNQKGTQISHGTNNTNKPAIVKNDIKGIILSKDFDQTKFEAVEPVQEYLSSQKRFNATVKTLKGLKEKMTGSWYYLGGGQRQLISSFDISGTGAEQVVWFWCEPTVPVQEGPWEFEAVMANGNKKTVAFNVAHDPALDIAPQIEPDFNDYTDYVEPDVYYPPVEVIEEPIEESYDYTQ